MARPPPTNLEYWEVPRCWPGECVAIIAGGRSLDFKDVDYLRDRCRVIAINRAYSIAPWADWLYGCDADRFWTWHPEAIEFAGIKIVVRPAGDVSSTPAKWPALVRLAEAGVKIIRHTGREYPQSVPRHTRLSADPAVVHGNNSLFQLLSVIHHTGVSTVLMLGADMQGGHWHSGYPTAEPAYESTIIEPFGSLVKPLAEAEVAVLNCTPRSALPYWRPSVALRSVL